MRKSQLIIAVAIIMLVAPNVAAQDTIKPNAFSITNVTISANAPDRTVGFACAVSWHELFITVNHSGNYYEDLICEYHEENLTYIALSIPMIGYGEVQRVEIVIYNYTALYSNDTLLGLRSTFSYYAPPQENNQQIVHDIDDVITSYPPVNNWNVGYAGVAICMIGLICVLFVVPILKQKSEDQLHHTFHMPSVKAPIDTDAMTDDEIDSELEALYDFDIHVVADSEPVIGTYGPVQHSYYDWEDWEPGVSDTLKAMGVEHKRAMFMSADEEVALIDQAKAEVETANEFKQCVYCGEWQLWQPKETLRCIRCNARLGNPNGDQT